MKEEERLRELYPETYPDRRIRLILDNMGSKHSLTLHPWLLVIAGGLLIAALAWLAVSLISTPEKADGPRLKKLELENGFLRERLDRYALELDSLKSVLDKNPAYPDTLEGVFPYFSGGEPNPIDKLRVNPGLVTKLTEIDMELGELKMRLGLAEPLSGGPLNLPDGFVAQGDGIPAIYPTFGRFTDGWGTRVHPITGEVEMHAGLDIANRTGTPVYATADGIVTKAEYQNGFGKVVTIAHAKGYATLYGHLSGFRVRPGEAVHKGQIIGQVGSTGMSTGPHLHYGVYRDGVSLNPSSFLNRIDAPELTLR